MLRYTSTADTAELRRDALIIMLVIAGISSALITSGTIINALLANYNWATLPFLLMFVVLFGANYLRRHQHIAAAARMLTVGMLLVPALHLYLLGPSHSVYYFFLLPVVAASVLLGGAAVLGIVLLSIGLIISLTTSWQAGPGISGVLAALSLTWAPCVMCLLAGFISYLNARNIFTMVGWALNAQEKDARRAHLFYQQSEQLQRAFQELEWKNDQLKSLNAELAEARRTAESANELKTLFLANISHELRTPLHIITGFSSASIHQNFSDDPLPAAITHNLDHIHRNAEHLLRLINDLLDLSSIEVGACELYPELIETRPFLENIFQSVVNSGIVAGAVQWELDLPDYVPAVHADPVRLRQVVLNLLSNAGKYTTHGRIVLGATVTLPHIHIWVADTGCGIAAELQERIFEPFMTSHPNTQPREGTGLGLSIAKRLVALHHGSLTVESKAGHGSTFRVYLPLPTLSKQLAAVPVVQRPVLLVLSTSDAIPEAIVTVSQREGVPIQRVAVTDTFHTVLTDIQPIGLACDVATLQPADWDIIHQLRTHPTLCRIPLILYGQPNAPTATAGGITDVVLKPVSESALVRSVHALQPHHSAKPILVIDDDPVARLMYHALLSEAFPELVIQVAEHGAAAVALLHKETPQLIILDLNMPDMDGFAVLQHIRTHPATRHTPVLVLSGRVLAREDVEQLHFARVSFQTKTILSPSEMTTQIAQLTTSKDHLPAQTSILVKQAIAYIQQHYTNVLSRHEIAHAIGVSERYLTQIFGEETGISPWDYLIRYRLMHAKLLLCTTTENVTTIATDVGFEDPAYFSRVFRKETGQSPTNYRLQNAHTSSTLEASKVDATDDVPLKYRK